MKRIAFLFLMITVIIAVTSCGVDEQIMSDLALPESAPPPEATSEAIPEITPELAYEQPTPYQEA